MTICKLLKLSYICDRSNFRRMRLDRKTKEALIKKIDSCINDTYMIKGGIDKRNVDVIDKSTMMLKDAMSKCEFFLYSGRMHFFNGIYYEGMDKDEFEYILDVVLDKRGVPAAEAIRKGIYASCWRRVIGNNVESLNRSMVCFSNGVVNFDDPVPVLKPHNARYPVFYMLPYPYNEKAICPLWESFLKEVLPDPTLVANLQEFLGLVFINRSRAKIETMMWLHGNGANGKSVIFNTIMGIFGRDNITNFDINELTSSSMKERNIATINGKLLNYCSDVDSKTILSDSVKALISGEPMMGRPMYRDGFTVYDIPLMMGNTNKVPYFKDDSQAWLRRIRPIPFEVTIPEKKQDKQLAAKLTKEYSGIMNWILQGRDRIIKNNYHFTNSEKIEAFIRNYSNNSTPIKQFESYLGIASTPTGPFDEGKTISAESFFYKYRRWAEMVKTRIEGSVMTDRGFFKALAEQGYLKQKGPHGYVYRYFGRDSLDNCNL